MPFKLNPFTGRFDYYDVSSAGTNIYNADGQLTDPLRTADLNGGTLLWSDTVSPKNVFSLMSNGRVGVGIANAYTGQVAYASNPTYASYFVVRTLNDAYGLNHNDGVVELASYIFDAQGVYWGTTTNHDYIFMTGDLGRGAIKSNGNFTFGALTDLSARVGIKGASSSNSTSSLIIQNSAGSEYALFRDDKYVALGGASPNGNVMAIDGANSAVMFNYTDPTAWDNCDFQILGTGLRSKLFQVWDGFSPLVSAQSSGSDAFASWDRVFRVGSGIGLFEGLSNDAGVTKYDSITFDGGGTGAGAQIGSSTDIYSTASRPAFMTLYQNIAYGSKSMSIKSVKGEITPNDSTPYLIPYLEMMSDDADSGGQTKSGKSRISSIGDSYVAVNTGTQNDYFGVGTDTPSAKLHILQDTVGTSVKGISVNFNTIGEVFYIDDNGISKFTTGQGLTVTGANGYIDLISDPGVNPGINFLYANGASTSGTLQGQGSSMFLLTGGFGVGNSTFNPASQLHTKGDGYGVFKGETSSGIMALETNESGYNILHAADGAIADGDLNASKMAFYIDETGNTLTVKVKYAGGTVKTGTVALT